MTFAQKLALTRSVEAPRLTPTKPVALLANIEDTATGQACELYAFRKATGEQGEVRVPRDQSYDFRKLRDVLILHNADLSRNKQKVRKQLEIATRSSPVYLQQAAHFGWGGDHKTFALQNVIVGGNRRAIRLQPPAYVENLSRFKVDAAGTLSGWRKKVARPCQRSSRLMTCLAAAFAAPLLHPASMQSFGLNLHGRSKSGKSTAALVAASVIGLSREGQLPNFNATDTSLLETARLCNDLVMPLNEAGLIKGSRSDAYEAYRSSIYALSEGQDRARNSRSKYATNPSISAFRIIYLPNSERSITEMAKLKNVERDKGEQARCWDIPATTPGHATVFDLLKSRGSKSKGNRIARRRLSLLRAAIIEEHGTAIRPYIKYLLGAGSSLPDVIERHKRTFLRDLQLPTSEGEIIHAAHNFALVYAGGCIAIEADVLPWTEREVLAAVRKCFQDGYAILKGEPSVKEEVSQILRQKTEELLSLRKDKRLQQGAWIRHNGAKQEIVVRSVELSSWFPTPGHVRQAVDLLERRRRLVLPQTRSQKERGSGYEFAVSTPGWPDGKKRKSIIYNVDASLAYKSTRRA